MPLAPAGRVVFGAFVGLLMAGPVSASGHADGHRLRAHHHASARHLPPEVRYRDPRYVPPRRLAAPRLGPPTDLIHAYLPRTTETPIYNEPPNRFPAR